jgi:hypothetical protein
MGIVQVLSAVLLEIRFIPAAAFPGWSQSGQSVKGASLMRWIFSSSCPQALHWYS